jgi:hypothetical protein
MGAVTNDRPKGHVEPDAFKFEQVTDFFDLGRDVIPIWRVRAIESLPIVFRGLFAIDQNHAPFWVIVVSPPIENDAVIELHPDAALMA